MQQKIRRTKTLDAFVLEISDLSALCTLLVATVETDGISSIEIVVQLKNDTYSFSSAQEVSDHEFGVNELTKFKITANNFGSGSPARYVLIESSDFAFFGSRAQVYSLSERHAWCMAVNEEVKDFLDGRRAWYYWLIHRKALVFLGGLSGIYLFLPISSPALYLRVESLFPTYLPTFLSSLAVCIFIFCTGVQERILPAARIRVGSVQRWSTRRWDRLLLACGILGAVTGLMSVANLFYEYFFK